MVEEKSTAISNDLLVADVPVLEPILIDSDDISASSAVSSGTSMAANIASNVAIESEDDVLANPVSEPEVMIQSVSAVNSLTDNATTNASTKIISSANTSLELIDADSNDYLLDSDSAKSREIEDEVEDYVYLIVSKSGSPLIQSLSGLGIKNLKLHLDPIIVAIDKSALECDALLFDMSSEDIYSVGQVCQRFEDIPIIALIPEGYAGDLKNLFKQGISDYVLEEDMSLSLLQALIKKTKLRLSVQAAYKAASLVTTQERLAKEYSDQLQAIVASSPMIACKWTSPDGYEIRFKFISKNISQIGYSSDELLTGEVKWPEIVHPDDVENNRVQLFTATIDGSSEVNFQYRIHTRDGEVRWLETHTILERRENGMVRYYQGFMLDITERKRAEAIKEQKNRELALLSKIQSAVTVCQSVYELYDSVTASLSEILDCEHVLIIQYHERQLMTISSVGYSSIPDTAELIDSAISKAVRRAKPLLFSEADLAKFGCLLPDAISSIGIPFFDNEKVVGALLLESQKEPFTEEDLSLMIKVGIQVNVAIENLRLQETTHFDLLRAQALYAVSQTLTESKTIDNVIYSVSEIILDVLSARWIVSYKINDDLHDIEATVSVSHKDRPLDVMTKEEYKDSLLYWAMKHRRIIRLDSKAVDPTGSDAAKILREKYEIGSMMAIPILNNNRVLGAIAVLNHVNDPNFTQDDANLVTAFVNQIAVAISQRELMSKIEHQAFHDALTELPNRTLFHDRLTTSLAFAKRSDSKVGLLFFDLDGFKTINDTLGHHIGDSLLIGIAERFSERMRDSDTLARMGGDEFAIILNDITDRQNAISVASDFLRLLEEPFSLQDHSVSVSASIGVSLYPDDGGDVATLLKYSDIAMYLAKDRGKNDVQSFTPELAEQVHERMTLEAELRTALENEEFILHYQPQVDICKGERIGLEALVRWNHPTKGLVAPPKFIPVTEETLLVVPLGKWILREACRQNAEWQAQGIPPILMAVNVSMQQFSQPDFVETVKEALEDSGLEPRYLELEVTEGVVMQHVDYVAEQLKELRSLGVKIALDDFGTGFSSLQYLQKLPFDKLKIDRSFIMDIEADERQKALVEAIITFAKSFDLEVIAEGVETMGQLKILQELGCRQAQGYYYDKPLEAIKTWDN